jgi:hypothetical protein
MLFATDPAECHHKRMKRLQEKRLASSGVFQRLLHRLKVHYLICFLFPNCKLMVTTVGKGLRACADSLGCGPFNQEYVDALKGMLCLELPNLML